jgi:hypothetical protein
MGESKGCANPEQYLRKHHFSSLVTLADSDLQPNLVLTKRLAVTYLGSFG